MADKFTRAFGSFLRRIIDMGDGTFSERVVAAPPPEMVEDGRLLVDAEMTFPPTMVTGDRLKVNLDEPIDVTLPAAMVVANRLQVDIPNPAPVTLPAAMIVANRLQVDVAQPVAVTLPAALVNANRVKVEVDDPIDVTLPAAMVLANRLQVDIQNPAAVTLPTAMVVANRLQTDTTLPAALINGNRLKVEVDDPIDVVLPAAMVIANRLQVDATLPSALVNANRLKVEVDDPIDVLLPASLITGTTKPRLRVDVGQTGFFEKREFETFREFATATTATYVLRVVSPVNFILQDLSLEVEDGTARLATFSGGTPTGTFSETLPYVAANTMTETPPAYTPQIVITAIPTGGSLAGGSAIRVLRLKTAGNSNFASSVGSTPDLVAGRAPGTYYLTLQLTAAICVLKLRFEERP